MADPDQALVNGHGQLNGQELNGQKVNGQAGGDWEGLDQTNQDPEEARVMFCALDSFL